jgi:hypothetical protein
VHTITFKSGFRHGSHVGVKAQQGVRLCRQRCRSFASKLETDGVHKHTLGLDLCMHVHVHEYAAILMGLLTHEYAGLDGESNIGLGDGQYACPACITLMTAGPYRVA